MADPFGLAQYCDDVRHEVGGKRSLMGVYGPQMSIHGVAPARMPQFFVDVSFLFLELPESKDLEIKIYYVSEGKVDLITPEIQITLPDELMHEEEGRTIIGSIVGISPFEIKADGRVEVSVFVGETEYKLNSLTIKFEDPNNSGES